MWFRSIRRSRAREERAPLATAPVASPGPEVPREPKPPGGRDLLVVANCQAFMLRALMQLSTERHRVAFVTLSEVKATCPDEAAIAALFSRYDTVFLEKSSNVVAVPPAVADRVVPYPPVFFYGLHPDLVYVWADGKPVQGPLGDYHSSIALQGFLLGMTVDRVVSLFNRGSYEALGFFDMFEESFEHYLGLARAEGFDMRPHLVRWLRRGAFMYSVNHPRSFVLEDVARELLARVDPEAGREAADRDVSEWIPDLLANGPVFPVYPELGLRLGIRGEYAFKPGDSFRRLSLREFVAASHEAYRAVGAERMSCPRVQGPRYAQLAELA